MHPLSLALLPTLPDVSQVQAPNLHPIPFPSCRAFSRIGQQFGQPDIFVTVFDTFSCLTFRGTMETMLSISNMPSPTVIPSALGCREFGRMTSLSEPTNSQLSHTGWPNLSTCDEANDKRLSLSEEIQVLARVVMDFCIAHAPWKHCSLTPESLMLLYPAQEQATNIN